jgi:ABC-type nitrate/sulfonate/bicarbonate transport system substrate-binding protein
MSGPARTELKIGFMPLLDCALLVVAHEVGMARQQGLGLRLVRESSWANIRDRVAVGHFEAAQMLAPMVIAENLGLGHFQTPLAAPVALGTGGNAITVSRELWQAMQADGASLGADPVSQARGLSMVVKRRAADSKAQLTLAMVFPFSCHNYQLRDWLESGGVDPDRDVRLVVLPPPLLVDALRSGQVDGFCVGEPWNSLAVDAGIGVIAASCSDVWPHPPEKVLGMRARFADENPEVVARLIRAIHGAALWAADAGNHEDLAAGRSQWFDLLRVRASAAVATRVPDTWPGGHRAAGAVRGPDPRPHAALGPDQQRHGRSRGCARGISCWPVSQCVARCRSQERMTNAVDIAVGRRLVVIGNGMVGQRLLEKIAATNHD